MTAEHVCPSSTADHAEVLLAVVGPDGRAHYVSPALPIDDDFRRAVTDRGRPEARFRFAGRCIESGCRQWTGSRCGVIDEVLEHDGADIDTELRPCTVRRDCRWFAQRGADACRVCPWVITDSQPSLEPAAMAASA